MTDSQPTSPSNFFAVAWGQQRGVFNTYKEAQAAMKGFPSPVYKKFKTKDEAEEFLKKSQPESTSIEADENDQKFYAVARGRVIGIFKDIETSKKNTKGYPNAMHKKFDSFEEAKQYLEKFSEGKVEEKKGTPKKSAQAGKKQEVEAEQDGEEEKAEGKPVARKRTHETTKVDQTEEDHEKKASAVEKSKNEGGEDESKIEEQEAAMKKMEVNGEKTEEKGQEGEEVKGKGPEPEVGQQDDQGMASQEKMEEESGEEPSKKVKLDEEEEGQLEDGKKKTEEKKGDEEGKVTEDGEEQKQQP